MRESTVLTPGILPNEKHRHMQAVSQAPTAQILGKLAVNILIISPRHIELLRKSRFWIESSNK
jgi:hypothetical protein